MPNRSAVIAGNKENISPQAKNTTLDSSTNITGLVIVCSNAYTEMPSSTKAMNMAFSRPIRSEIQPQKGRVMPLTMRFNWMASTKADMPQAMITLSTP